MDITFTLEIKKEIISKIIPKNDIKSLLKGIQCALYNAEEEKVIFNIKNPEIKLFIEENAKKIGFKFDKKIEIQNIVINSPQHFFAGVFLVTGSCSKIETSKYHIEFSIKNENIANIIENKLKNHNLLFSRIYKKNNIVFYGKNMEIIKDFLSSIGANKSFFKFTEKTITRDFENQLNRISNLDIHNQNKLVDSNAFFKEYYEIIINNNLTSEFKENELLFYKLKLKYSFLPLSELSIKLEEKYNIKRTKSGLNHWLIKLRKIAEDFEFQQEKNK
ncbi:MAG: DNA-binding protein WhiA [Metamycoplasmataceae bacterium]